MLYVYRIILFIFNSPLTKKKIIRAGRLKKSDEKSDEKFSIFIASFLVRIDIVRTYRTI